jgi:hypothetical protein
MTVLPMNGTRKIRLNRRYSNDEPNSTLALLLALEKDIFSTLKFWEVSLGTQAVYPTRVEEVFYKANNSKTIDSGRPSLGGSAKRRL